MDRKRIEYEFWKLKEAVPGVKITEDRRFVLIPSIMLSDRYNLPSTPALINFEGSELVGLGEVYVSSKLLVNGEKSIAFLDPVDENMKNAGWLRLCWKNPPPVENLRSFVASLMVYLRDLEK